MVLLGQVTDVKNKTRSRRSRITENIAAVVSDIKENACENPGLCVPRRSWALGISPTSLHRILHKDLGLKVYKAHLTQELNPADHQQRRVFADWVFEIHEYDPEFHQKIIFTDEAHFHLDAYDKTQNCRIWGSKKPRFIVEKPLDCQLFGEVGATVTVNRLRYQEMINNSLWQELDGINLDNVQFQQATYVPHKQRNHQSFKGNISGPCYLLMR